MHLPARAYMVFVAATTLAVTTSSCRSPRPSVQPPGEGGGAAGGARPANAAGAPGAEQPSVRPPAVAGPKGQGFYPSDPAALKQQIADFLANANVPTLPGDVVAVLVPHAGYEFCGQVMAHSFKLLQGRPFKTVLLLGNSHHAQFEGAALSPDDAWDTPLGRVAVDRDICRALLAQGDLFTESREVHAREHALEVEVPFIQTVLPGANIVPILLGQASPETCKRVGAALAPYLARPDVVMVISSDMSHYPSKEDARRTDRATLDALLTLDPDRIFAADQKLMHSHVSDLECTMCGLCAAVTGIVAAKAVGVDKGTVLDYANSGDTANMPVHCVGYGAVAFTASRGKHGPPAGSGGGAAGEGAKTAPSGDTPKLSAAARQRLLTLARATITSSLTGEASPSLSTGGDASLGEKRACFVTLKESGELRGCIGGLEAQEPLIEAVAHRAKDAAFSDPRFRPVKREELPQISIEISVMSPLRKVRGPEEIVVGTHGVVVKQGWHSGVFLPQVAPEQHWDRDRMLTELCVEKAGLPPDAWKHGAELYVFTADVFGEAEP